MHHLEQSALSLLLCFTSYLSNYTHTHTHVLVANQCCAWSAVLYSFFSRQSVIKKLCETLASTFSPFIPLPQSLFAADSLPTDSFPAIIPTPPPPPPSLSHTDPQHACNRKGRGKDEEEKGLSRRRKSDINSFNSRLKQKAQWVGGRGGGGMGQEGVESVKKGKHWHSAWRK